MAFTVWTNKVYHACPFLRWVPMIEQLATIIAPVFICACLGILWARSGTPFDADFVARIVMYVGVPCLVISGLGNIEVNPALLGKVTLIAAGLSLAMGLIGYLLIRLSGHDTSVYLPPFIFGNNGNMGIPLCYLAFGNEGMAMALCFFVLLVISHASIGIAIVNVNAGGIKERLTYLLTQPIVYATLIAAVLMLTDKSLPRWLGETIDMLAGIAIPLMLIALGTSLASIKMGALKRSLIYSVLRIGIGFLLGLATVFLLDLDGVMRGVILIQAAMPAAIFNYLLALRYNREPSEIASLVVTSTILSFLTLPFLLTFALQG